MEGSSYPAPEFFLSGHTLSARSGHFRLHRKSGDRKSKTEQTHFGMMGSALIVNGSLASQTPLNRGRRFSK